MLRVGSAGALLAVVIGGVFLGFERLPFLFPMPKRQSTVETLDAYEVALAMETREAIARQAIDGFTAGSVPINWWFSLYGSDEQPVFASVPVAYVDGKTCIRYPYPERGDWNACALQLPDFHRPIDTSLYDAIEFVARADELAPLGLEISFTDRAIPPHPDDPPEFWGANTAELPHVIWLSPTFRTFRVPLDDFHVQSWNLERYPEASCRVNPATFNEIRFRLQDDEGVLEIRRVSLVRFWDTPVPIRSEVPDDEAFLASLNNDEREQAGLDHAFMQEGESAYGTFWEMVWESPSPVDLTCFIRRGIPPSATAFSVVLSASEPMQVEVWAHGGDLQSGGWKNMISTLVLAVDATPTRYVIPFDSFTESEQLGLAPFTPEEWIRASSLILWPSASEGALQVYEVSYAAPGEN